MLLRTTALILLAAAASVLHYSASPILEQNQKVREWPAVDATVTARFVENSGPRKRHVAAAGATRPFIEQLPATNLVVEYRHEANGVIYRRVQPTPRTEELAPAGPNLFTDREASYTRKAHYDPAKPSELFIPKAFGLGDYGQVFFWAPVFALGFGALVLRKPGGSLATASGPSERGWHPLQPKYSIRHRVSGAWGVAIACNLIAGWAAYDFFTGEPRTRSALTSALACVALLPGFVAAGIAMYYSWMARRVGDARVWLDAPRATPGTRLAARFELPVKADVEIEQVVVTLACVRSEFTGSLRFTDRVIWEQRFERAPAHRRRAAAGGKIEFEQRFEVPPDAQPSFAGGVTGPWIEWEIRVEFHLDNGPDYRGKFPLVMEAA